MKEQGNKIKQLNWYKDIKRIINNFYTTLYLTYKLYTQILIDLENYRIVIQHLTEDHHFFKNNSEMVKF